MHRQLRQPTDMLERLRRPSEDSRASRWIEATFQQDFELDAIAVYFEECSD